MNAGGRPPLLAYRALLALAARLMAHRDFGGGLLDTPPGNARAGWLLSTPFGLAVRLQRGLLIGWAIGLSLWAALRRGHPHCP